jgi:hypothetical protein
MGNFVLQTGPCSFLYLRIGPWGNLFILLLYFFSPLASLFFFLPHRRMLCQIPFSLLLLHQALGRRRACAGGRARGSRRAGSGGCSANQQARARSGVGSAALGGPRQGAAGPGKRGQATAGGGEPGVRALQAQNGARGSASGRASQRGADPSGGRRASRRKDGKAKAKVRADLELACPRMQARVFYRWPTQLVSAGA